MDILISDKVHSKNKLEYKEKHYINPSRIYNSSKSVHVK